MYENIVDSLQKPITMQKLTSAEEELMQAVWKTNGGFIRDFMEHLSEAPPYTTVASTIRNLEKKGFVTSRKMANSFYYEPAIAAAAYSQTSVSGVVKDYFANSYKDLVTFFAKEKKITPDELKEIIAMIEGKKNRKS